MSKSVLFKKTGAPDVMEIVDEKIPEPKQNEVRIQVKALGLNRAESMWRSGDYIEEPNLPARNGYEASGLIEAVGPGISEFKVGDVVSVIPSFSLNQYGMYGELVLAPDWAVVKHPTNLTFEEAASIWMMFVTVYDGLILTAKVTKDDTVLIPAASSSVGLAAIQVTNAIGAKSVALTRTSEKREELLKAGAAYVIATEEQDLVAEVMKITDGKGATVSFDPVGGPTFPKLIAASARFARIVVYGALSSAVTPLPMLPMLNKLPLIMASVTASTSTDPIKRKAAIEYITSGLKSGVLKPVIAKTFTFDQIIEAHKYLESNQQIGKIVVTV